jgi:hypothetical protein
MSVSGHGTCHYQRVRGIYRRQAPLVIHLHPVVARTSRGQTQIVHLVLSRSREHSRPSSPSELIRSRATEEGEENRSWGSPRNLEGITSIDLRRHQFLNHLFCARGLKAFTRMA